MGYKYTNYKDLTKMNIDLDKCSLSNCNELKIYIMQWGDVRFFILYICNAVQWGDVWLAGLGNNQ